MTPREGEKLARAFIDYCAGIETAGMEDFAQRGRVVADALLRALDALAAERSARKSIQEQRDRCLEILGGRS